MRHIKPKSFLIGFQFYGVSSWAYGRQLARNAVGSIRAQSLSWRRGATTSRATMIRAGMSRFMSSVDEESNNNEEDEEEGDASSVVSHTKLEPVTVKNYAFSSLIEMEQAGELELRPFYQRGFKWSQKQSSLWIESILRGYPCLPEITLLQTEEGYAVFDGQQRLTSIKLFIKGMRGDMWKATRPQRKAKTDRTFALEGLTLLPDLEGKTFKDLDKTQQKFINRQFDIRCAIIPDSWSMADYVEFFKRIQGGGTPMTDQELRRAITRGPFTDLLDSLAEKTSVEGELLHSALSGFKLETDETQELLLRYFSMQYFNPRSLGKPSLIQQGLQTMKLMNKKAASAADSDLIAWKTGLKAALEVALIVFPDDERFRRATPINPGDNPTRVWSTSDKVNKSIWDCVIYAFSKPERKNLLIENAASIRDALVELMQTHPAFANAKVKGTESRIAALEAEVEQILSASKILDAKTGVKAPMHSSQTRRELIAQARQQKLNCAICQQPLGPLDDLLHIDHQQARARGGGSDLLNLQVTHKSCNLKKSAQ